MALIYVIISDADLLLPKLLAQLNCNSDDGTKNDKMNSHAVVYALVNAFVRWCDFYGVVCSIFCNLFAMHTLIWRLV